MSLSEILASLVHNTRDVSLPAFLPELILSATVVLMLAIRVPTWGRKVNVFWIALLGVALALIVTAPQYYLSAGVDSVRPALVPEAAVKHLGQEIFTGFLVYDPFTIFFRGVLLVFAFLFIVLTRLTGIPDEQEGPDFYTLVIGSVTGMCLMISANHLLIVFLGVEMASVPAYVLAGTLKGRRKASEAALKFAVYGAGAAGVMLYGISLLAGTLGSAHIPTMALRLSDILAADTGERTSVLILGGLMLAVGLAFKLSAVPFHFWAPDVFEGATAEIGAFLSVASKAAALALLVRVAIGLGGESLVAMKAPLEIAGEHVAVAEPDAVPRVTLAADAPKKDEAKKEEPAKKEAAEGAAKPEVVLPPATAKSVAKTPLANLAPARNYIVMLISLLAAVTATFGNMAAFGQTNIKRLLAYSTIAHAGYMMMPVAAAVALMGDPTHKEAAQEAVASLSVYVATYLFMNLSAFAIVAFLRNVLRSEEIADYAGLIKRAPGITICFSVVLFSLLGLPPLAGFVAKFAIFAAVIEAELWVLAIVGGLNTVLSLLYYLRVVRVMALDPEPASATPARFSLLTVEGIYVLIVTAPIAVLIFAWEPLKRMSMAATAGLF